MDYSVLWRDLLYIRHIHFEVHSGSSSSLINHYVIQEEYYPFHFIINKPSLLNTLWLVTDEIYQEWNMPLNSMTKISTLQSHICFRNHPLIQKKSLLLNIMEICKYKFRFIYEPALSIPYSKWNNIMKGIRSYVWITKRRKTENKSAVLPFICSIDEVDIYRIYSLYWEEPAANNAKNPISEFDSLIMYYLVLSSLFSR